MLLMNFEQNKGCLGIPIIAEKSVLWLTLTREHVFSEPNFESS